MDNVPLIEGPYTGNFVPYNDALRHIFNNGYVANTTLNQHNPKLLLQSPNGTSAWIYIDDAYNIHVVSIDALGLTP